MTLQEYVRAELAGRWADAMPEAWRPVFGNAAPDINVPLLAQLQDGEFGPLYPPLQHPDGLDLFRSFRNINPDHVRVVVIGQDPYPEAARATGRAFEDRAAHDIGFSNSLRRLLQSAFGATWPQRGVDQNYAGWDQIRGEVESHLATAAAMAGYFDGLARQNVLFLNSAWTYTEADPQADRMRRTQLRTSLRRAHRAMWQPVMLQITGALCDRQQPPVFVLLGEYAQSLVVGNDDNIIRHPHPAARHGAYLNGQNPLSLVNIALGENPIQWWPTREPRL